MRSLFLILFLSACAIPNETALERQQIINFGAAMLGFSSQMLNPPRTQSQTYTCYKQTPYTTVYTCQSN